MPANLAYHIPIGSVQTVSGNTPFTRAIPEQAGQTFPFGVPVQQNAGFIRLWDGATVVRGIAGFALINASNLATNGKGAPGTFGQVGAPGAIATYGTVPYQTSAVNIAEGTPMTDGRTLFEVANEDTIFLAQCDNANGAVAADYTPTLATVGTQYGLTVDASGQWYVDFNKSTVGTNTVCVVVAIDPVDGLIPNARLYIEILPGARQISA